MLFFGFEGKTIHENSQVLSSGFIDGSFHFSDFSFEISNFCFDDIYSLFACGLPLSLHISCRVIYDLYHGLGLNLLNSMFMMMVLLLLLLRSTTRPPIIYIYINILLLLMLLLLLLIFIHRINHINLSDLHLRF